MNDIPYRSALIIGAGSGISGSEHVAHVVKALDGEVLTAKTKSQSLQTWHFPTKRPSIFFITWEALLRKLPLQVRPT